MDTIKATKFLLAAIAIAIVVSSVNSTADENKTVSSPLGILFKTPLKINIISLSAQAASPQNSKPVTVTFNVSSIFVRGICGLNASNFKLTTISAPPHAPLLVIAGLYPWNDPYAANNCKCNISIAPFALYGLKPKWVSGIYKERLDYIVGGQIKANTTFSFAVKP